MGDEPKKVLSDIFVGRSRILISASSESGKTHLLMRMLLNPNMLNYRRYHKIYIISTFFEEDEAYGVLQDVLEEAEIDYEVFLDYSDTILEGIKNDIKKIRKEQASRPFLEAVGISKEKKRQKPEDYEFLIVLDDIAGQKGVRTTSMGSDQSLNRLSFMGRHLKIDYVICVQSLRSLSPAVWENSNILIFFDSISAPTIKIIHEQVGSGMPPREFARMWDWVMNEPYSFLLVNKKKHIRKEDRFYKKFAHIRMAVVKRET